MAKLNGQLLSATEAQVKVKLLSRGFTLVELMVVIALTVSARIALPSFISQQNKAKLTEASTKLAILKAAHAEYQFGSSELDAITIMLQRMQIVNLGVFAMRSQLILETEFKQGLSQTAS